MQDHSVWPVSEFSLNKEDDQKMSQFYCKSRLGEITTTLTVVTLPDTVSNIFEGLLERSNNLDFVLKVVAVTTRAAKMFLQSLNKVPSDRVESSKVVGVKLLHSSKNNLDQRGSTPTGTAVVKIIDTKIGKRNYQVVSSQEVTNAWNLLVTLEQVKDASLIKTKKHLMLKTVEKVLSDGSKVTQLVLGSRIKLFPIGFEGSQEVPYLPQGHFARMIATKVHNKYHVDVDTTACHVRRNVFIPQLRRILGCIDRNCIICKLKRNKFSGQRMGALPHFRTAMSPPFSCVLMDLFGPFIIKDDCIKRGPRTSKKVWGLLFSCASTRAIHLDVAVDYDTNSILHCIRRLKAQRGNVRIIVSDPGSQLVGASNVLKEWRNGWSNVELAEFGAQNGIEWQFVMANSQFQNGGAEIMVKLAKGVMKVLMGELAEKRSSLNELNTVLCEASNIINSCPIGIKPNQDSDTEFLTPNSLLLGRNSDTIDSGPFHTRDKFDQGLNVDCERFQLVQKVIGQFWTVWQQNYFPTLLVRRKWHYRQRNLKVGDLCFMKDSNEHRGQFRRCKVVRVFPDRHGVVRNVEVLVTNRQNGSGPYFPQTLSRLKRHVSNLVVIRPVEEEDTLCLKQPDSNNQNIKTFTNVCCTFRNLVECAPSDTTASKSSPEDPQIIPENLQTAPEDPCAVPVMPKTSPEYPKTSSYAPETAPEEIPTPEDPIQTEGANQVPSASTSKSLPLQSRSSPSYQNYPTSDLGSSSCSEVDVGYLVVGKPSDQDELLQPRELLAGSVSLGSSLNTAA